MSRFAALTGLAFRDLWISFRLLTVLSALLLAGMAAALLPSVLDVTPQAAYAVALTVATVAAAAVTALSLSSERVAGSAAWLAIRAVPRPAILLAWLTALVAIVAVGLLASALVGGLAIAQQPGVPISTFLLGVMAAGAAMLTAVAGGLLVGALLPPATATSAGALLAVALVAPGLLLAPGAALAAGGFALIANVAAEAHPLPVALQSSGLALVIAAILLGAAAAALARADL